MALNRVRHHIRSLLGVFLHSDHSLCITRDCTGVKGLVAVQIRKKWGSSASVCQETDFCHYRVGKIPFVMPEKKMFYETSEKNVSIGRLLFYLILGITELQINDSSLQEILAPKDSSNSRPMQPPKCVK